MSCCKCCPTYRENDEIDSKLDYINKIAGDEELFMMNVVLIDDLYSSEYLGVQMQPEKRIIRNVYRFLTNKASREYYQKNPNSIDTKHIMQALSGIDYKDHLK